MTFSIHFSSYLFLFADIYLKTGAFIVKMFIYSISVSSSFPLALSLLSLSLFTLFSFALYLHLSIYMSIYLYISQSIIYTYQSILYFKIKQTNKRDRHLQSCATDNKRTNRRGKMSEQQNTSYFAVL